MLDLIMHRPQPNDDPNPPLRVRRVEPFRFQDTAGELAPVFFLDAADRPDVLDLLRVLAQHPDDDSSYLIRWGVLPAEHPRMVPDLLVQIEVEQPVRCVFSIRFPRSANLVLERARHQGSLHLLPTLEDPLPLPDGSVHATLQFTIETADVRAAMALANITWQQTREGSSPTSRARAN